LVYDLILVIIIAGGDCDWSQTVWC